MVAINLIIPVYFRSLKKHHFTKTSHIDFDKTQIIVAHVDFDGSFRVGDYILIMKNVIYKRIASMRVTRTSVIADSKPVKEKLSKISTIDIVEPEPSKKKLPRTSTIDFLSRFFILLVIISIYNALRLKNLRHHIAKKHSMGYYEIHNKLPVISVRKNRY